MILTSPPHDKLRADHFTPVQQSPKKARPKLLADGLVEPLGWPEPAAAMGKRRAFAKIRSHDWSTALLFIACDIVCWVVLYGFVGYARRDAFFVSPFEFMMVDFVALGVLLQALYIVGGYNRNTETRGLTYTTEHILAIAGAAAVSSLLIYSAATFDAGMKPSRGVLLISFIVFIPLSLIYRREFRWKIVASTAEQAFLVVGSGELASRFYEAYKRSPNQQRLVFVDNDESRVGSTITGEGSPMVEGGLDIKLGNLQNAYSGIILAEKIKHLPSELLERLVRTQFQRTRVYTLESFYETHWRYVPLDVIDPVWPLQTGFQLARISPYHYLKRLFDVVVSGFLLLICAPLLPLIVILIWMESGKPVIFRQPRVGGEGQMFIAYKFRTMFTRSAAAETDDIYTRENDPRITRMGRWLRKLRLDELPQLWNVFRGEMSLIGPRAEWIKCAERYEKAIPFYHFRHLVKPGITGWAQVNYPYGESDEDAIEKLKYDLYYIRHYSLKLDAMIILKTVHTMLFGRGR
jgi:exopolysaccharide biosynthesis polyprenyl glycosylphosphotransferase